MGDLSAQINSILNSPEGMQQIQNMASALGLGNMMGNMGNANTNQPPPNPTPPPNEQNAYTAPQMPNNNYGMQGSPQMQMPPAPPPMPQAPNPAGAAAGGFDLSNLMGMLGQMGIGNNQQSAQTSSMPSIDMNTILKLQRAMQAFTVGNKNVDLLRSLKPHLSEKRAKKVDDAVRIMQLINMLPMIKESGLFGFGGGSE